MQTFIIDPDLITTVQQHKWRLLSNGYWRSTAAIGGERNPRKPYVWPRNWGKVYENNLNTPDTKVKY